MRYGKRENRNFTLFGLEADGGQATAPFFGPLFNVVHFVRAKSGYLYRRHTHSLFELIIPLRKDYKCLLNGVSLSLATGRALLIQPGDSHQDIYSKGMEYCGMIFDLRMPAAPCGVKRIFKDGVPPLAQIVDFRETDRILRVKSLLAEDAGSSASPFTHYMLHGALCEMFWAAAMGIPKAFLSPQFLARPEQERFKTALLSLFDAGASGKLPLDAMAAALDMSPSAFSHKAKDALGMPPSKAFLNFKMLRAKRLLSETAMSVKEIGDSLGFENQFHFSRAFKRCVGAPPSAFR